MRDINSLNQTCKIYAPLSQSRVQGGKMKQWGKMNTCNIRVSMHRMAALVHVIIKVQLTR